MKKGRKSKKSKYIAVLFFLLFMIFFSGCGTENETTVEITVIHGWGSNEKDHVAMRQIYSDFEKENPDIKVHLISMPTGKELLRKVGDMILVGEIPDVIFFGGTGNNEIYKYMVKNDLAVDIMPYIEEDEEFSANIAASNLSYWKTLDGKLFSISDTLMLSGGYWYNQKIFEQAGIKEIPKTWTEFIAVCEQIKTWSEEKGSVIKPLQVSAEGYLYFVDHMLADNGGRGEKNIGWNKIELDENEVEQILEILRQIYSFSASNDENYSYRDETDLFNEGKLAIYVNGVWGAPMIEENIQAEYALLPSYGEASISCESTGLGYVVGKTGVEAKQEASVRFLKYMLSETVQERILLETEQVPANANVSVETHKEEMQRFYQGVALVKAAEKKIETPENLWEISKKTIFEENILDVLENHVTADEFISILE